MVDIKALDDDGFEKPILTVDVVLFTMIDGHLCVLLVNRDKEPCEGLPGLIGGYIHTNEDLDTHAAAKRVARNKIGINVSHLEQLGTFSGPDRDPRGWSATVTYIAVIKSSALTNSLRAEFQSVDSLPEEMAFDHGEIIHWAVKRIRNKSSYSSLPLLLMPGKFTLLELQSMYESLLEQEFDDRTFRRKILDLDLVRETGEMSDGKVTKVRPAKLYRPAGKALWVKSGGEW